MTINYARESVIDFTKPFMNLGIGILFKVTTSHITLLPRSDHYSSASCWWLSGHVYTKTLAAICVLLALGSDQPANATVLLHESTGRGDLAVRAGRLPARLVHAVRDGPFLAVRMEQPASVPAGIGRR